MARNDADPGTGSSVAVRLGGKYEILPGTALPELRQPHAGAFSAVNREIPSERLFALVCDPGLPPRQEWINQIALSQVEGLVVPRAAGVIDWPLAQRRCCAIIFDQPSGARMASALSDTITPFTEDEVIFSALPQVVAALRAVCGAGLTHRAIRPTNLFYRGAGDRRILLGECVSAPPVPLQPAAYETIEGGMTAPRGRGEGSSADDVYALGVTLIFLLVGRDLTQGMSEDRLLVEKMSRGSYSALIGSARLPMRMVEAIRGMTVDDADERWTFEELESWVQGRRVSAKQVSMPKRAGRPFDLGTARVDTARSLAHELTRDPALAIRAIRSPDFDVWLQRSLADQPRTTAVATALDDASGTESASQDARLVARVAMALDPAAPIRYGGIAIAIDGFGPALAAAFLGRAPVTTIGEMLAIRLPQFWVTLQGDVGSQHAPLLRNFERLRVHLDDRRPGFGLERILYELNPAIHCLSPALEREHILDPGLILRALEKLAQSGELGETLIDRHLAAFIAARFRNAGTDWHEPLGSADPAQRSLATLQVLARLQGHRGPPAVPALSERIARELPAVVDRLHNRVRRSKVKEGISRLASRGSLSDLLALLADARETARDNIEFERARREVAQIERALRALDAAAPNRPLQAIELGGRMSLRVANVIAWIAAAAAALAR